MTPVTALTAASRGLLTSRSTTSEDAPGYTAMIDARGRSIEGMSSCFKTPVTYRPRPETRSVSSAITVRCARLTRVKRVM